MLNHQTKPSVKENLYILCSTIALEANNFVAMALALIVRERLSLCRFLHIDAPLDQLNMVLSLLTVELR